MVNKTSLIFILIITLAIFGCENNGIEVIEVGDSKAISLGEALSSPTTLITINAAGDTFVMGDGRHGPDVEQAISYDFQISKYEITKDLFALFVNEGGYSNPGYWTTNGWAYKELWGWTEPTHWTDPNFNGTDQPVVGVSWWEAVAFCNWASDKMGYVRAYDADGRADIYSSGYRLPTEVEWEYTAAKGAPGVPERLFAWGDTGACWNAVGSVPPCSFSQTANVGSNPIGNTPQGVTDMTGNAWEWLSDNYQADGSVAGGMDRYYFVDDQLSETFVVRGGAWIETSEVVFQNVFRVNYNPNWRFYGLGFRVVRHP